MLNSAQGSPFVKKSSHLKIMHIQPKKALIKAGNEQSPKTSNQDNKKLVKISRNAIQFIRPMKQNE